MRILKVVVSVLVVTVGAVASVNGCSNDNKTTSSPTRVSQKGEACQVTNDCAGGLACLPIPGNAGGICVVGQFNISVTAKECAVIECEQAGDCCQTISPALMQTCNQLLQQCALDAGFASMQACQTYNLECKCDTTKIDCVSNACVTHCAVDQDCSGNANGSKCAGGACVQCGVDSDCPSADQQCLSGVCQSPCQTDGDCAGFNRCLVGKCVAGGCQTDCECVAATRNVQATCGTDGKCIVPCQTDLECGSPTSYSFFSCINAQCLYTGCQTDKDCRLLFSGPSDAGTLKPNEHIICRDKAGPGTETVPAH